jgi:hypothetical protein
MKGLNLEFYHHKINLAKDAIPVQQRRYRLNSNYATKVKEEIDKLLRVGFIWLVKWATWLSPIVVVLKKNGKLRICINYRKLNAATITDAFPLDWERESRTSVVQPLDWEWEFHVFVDASDIAIGRVLMQRYEKNWFRPVYYASR